MGIAYQPLSCVIVLYLRKIEPEVELPCSDGFWTLASLIHEGDANLYQVQKINITTQNLNTTSNS